MGCSEDWRCLAFCTVSIEGYELCGRCRQTACLCCALFYRSHDGYKEEPNGLLLPNSPKYADQKKVFDDLGMGVLDNAFKGTFKFPLANRGTSEIIWQWRGTLNDLSWFCNIHPACLNAGPRWGGQRHSGWLFVPSHFESLVRLHVFDAHGRTWFVFCCWWRKTKSMHVWRCPR